MICQRELTSESDSWLKSNQVLDAGFLRRIIRAAQKWCDAPISDREVAKCLRGEMYETQGENYAADDLLTQIEIWFKEGIPNEYK